MAYKIQYYRHAQLYIEVFWDDDLPDTRDTAKKGLRRNRAEFATIIDTDSVLSVVERRLRHSGTLR